MPATSDDASALARAAGERLAAAGRIGIVLGGGGAKGAYQVGCWKALRECGITRFGAVAGTSVGALNAVLIAQDDFAKAEAIWHDMHLGRVLRFHWHVLLAAAIRVLLFVPYFGKHRYPAKAIPVAWWRAMRDYEERMKKDPDPRHLLRAAWQIYLSFVSAPGRSDLVSTVVLGVIGAFGASLWWVLSAPLLTLALIVLAGPLVAVIVFNYTAWLVTLLDLVSTKLVLASNEPLHRLLVECVDAPRLRARTEPLFVTLASLKEVSRLAVAEVADFPLPVPAVEAAPEALPGLRGWWQRNVGGTGDDADFGRGRPSATALPAQALRLDTVEYVPTHFDVRKTEPGQLTELILQSAGLPEIFPVRRFAGEPFVDGGLADNQPLTALAALPGQAAIIVIPLDAAKDESAVRADLVEVHARLGRPVPASLPELLVLTPSRSLGCFLTGTLDFRAVKARALMQLGYTDTLHKLAARQRQQGHEWEAASRQDHPGR